jgi:hypothetical protein
MRSHVIHPAPGLSLLCIVGSPKENVTSVVEDHLLETLSGIEWNEGEEDTDFSYVTEKCNHFLGNLAEEDEIKVQIIFGIEKAGHLMVASIGECEVILEERDGKLSHIHEDTRGHHRFELISSGDIPHGGTIFIVSKALESSLGDSFYHDAARPESDIFGSMTQEALSRELRETAHIIRIRKEGQKKESPEKKRRTPILSKHVSEYKEKFLLFWERSEYIHRVQETFGTYFHTKNTLFLSVFLGIGMIIFISLVSYLIGTLFSFS